MWLYNVNRDVVFLIAFSILQNVDARIFKRKTDSQASGLFARIFSLYSAQIFCCHATYTIYENCLSLSLSVPPSFTIVERFHVRIDVVLSRYSRWLGRENRMQTQSALSRGNPSLCDSAGQLPPETPRWAETTSATESGLSPEMERALPGNSSHVVDVSPPFPRRRE